MLHTLDRNLVFNVSNYQILVHKIHFCLIEGSLTNYVDKLAWNQIRKPIVNNVHNELNILKYKQTTSDRPGPQPRPKFKPPARPKFAQNQPGFLQNVFS